MKNQKVITWLVGLIVVLAVGVSLAGLLIGGGEGTFEFKAITGEVVKIYGQGLYRWDSISTVAQGKASDLITLVMGVPLLIGSMVYVYRGSFKARLLLSGTLGYFLYTYMSYVFLWTYNPLFIAYVVLMSASLYALVLSVMSFDLAALPTMFDEHLPVKFLGGFQIFIGVMIGLLWLGKIAPSITSGAVPVGLEHYTTLVIQGMDLGFIVPTALLSGVMLIKKQPLGYLLSSVMIMKAITMLSAITAMIINMALSGVTVSWIEVVLFFNFDCLAIISLCLLLRHTREPWLKARSSN